MNIFLDEYVVMPDHFHAILFIGTNQYNNKIIDTNTNNYKNKFGQQSKNLSSIIRGFKSSVTIYARKNNYEFGWQNLFYDHIIRSQREFYKIRRYIINNPIKLNNGL